MKLYLVARRAGQPRSVLVFEASEMQAAAQVLSDLRGAQCEAAIVAAFGLEDAMATHPGWFEQTTGRPRF